MFFNAKSYSLDEKKEDLLQINVYKFFAIFIGENNLRITIF